MQSEDFTDGWDPVHVGLEGAAFSIDGINPWSHAATWQRVAPDSIVVAHPAHRDQRHRAMVYEITAQARTIRFAAVELSNGVWGFHVPRQVAQ